MRASAMPLHFDEAMTALHWATDLQEFRFRNRADPLAEILHFADALNAISARVPTQAPVLPAPTDDPMGFLDAARIYLSLVVLDPDLSAALPGATITVH